MLGQPKLVLIILAVRDLARAVAFYREVFGWPVLVEVPVYVEMDLANFDAALVGYTFATLFATFGITYRYAMWLQRPPTRCTGARLAGVLPPRFLAGNLGRFVQRAVVEFAGNRFIFRRSALRGLTHWLIMWGCLLAAAITFPLVFGWIHFETVPGHLDTYRTFVFGFAAGEFPVDSSSPSCSSTGSSGRRSWCSPA
jgi:catechol 2,3-dioxygenase-like lactoylglutathione lyase family enzyme